VLDVERFLPLSSFLANVERVVEEMTESGRTEGTVPIMLSGTARPQARRACT
jgi:hypothetical protein